MRSVRFLFRLSAIAAFGIQVPEAVAEGSVFTNPVDPTTSADPFVAYHEGNYYYLKTRGNRIEIKQSDSLEGIGDPDSGPVKEVYRGSESFPDRPITRIWAPELHRVRVAEDEWRWWVISSGTSPNDRGGEGRPENREWMKVFFLESTTDDPMGEYVFKNTLTPPYPAGHQLADKNMIDASLLVDETGAPAYLAWSQYLNYAPPQAIFIGRVSNLDPIEVSDPVELSRPNFSWEREGWGVNEGPQFLQRDGRTVIVFSVSAFQSEHYSLSMMYNDDGDLLNPDSWTRIVRPVFKQSKRHRQVSLGHNDFVTTPDGQDWIVYHSREWFGNDQDPPFSNVRRVSMQRFHWDENNLPVFPEPSPFDVPLAAPFTEWTPPLRNGLAVTYFTNADLEGEGISMYDLDIDADYLSYAPLSSMSPNRYSVRWEGVLIPPQSGDYQFFVESDNRARFELGGEWLVDDWVTGPARTRTASVALEAGRIYPIKMEYSHEFFNSGAKLHWRRPGGSREPVPYYHMHPPSGGLRGAYFDNESLEGIPSVRLDPALDFQWSHGTPFPGAVGADYFSIRWNGYLRAPDTGDYTFYLNTTGGVRAWIDGRKMVDDWDADGDSGMHEFSVWLIEGSPVAVVVESRFAEGDSEILLEWQLPDGGRKTISTGSFSPHFPEADSGWFEAGWTPGPGGGGWWHNESAAGYWSYAYPFPGWLERKYFPWVHLPQNGWIRIYNHPPLDDGFLFFNASGRSWYWFQADRFPDVFSFIDNDWIRLPTM